MTYLATDRTRDVAEPVVRHEPVEMGRGLRFAKPLAIVGAVVAVAVLTGLTYLIRAGGNDADNWPVAWQLLNSDSGVLYQVANDIFSGRELDWSFSGQVYVFPEIPISLAAYAIGAGGIYRYFLIVAIINNALIFLTLLAMVRLRWNRESLGASLARAGLAMVALIVLPLIGSTWVTLYHLGATYYIGMYLMVIWAPALFLAKRRWVRVLIAIGIALTAASNPLGLVFAIPAFAIVLLGRWIKQGFRHVLRPAGAAAVVLVLALVVRLAFFSKMQGASPTHYMNPSGLFSSRLPELAWYFGILLSDPINRAIVVIGAGCSVACLVLAVVGLLRYVRTTTPRDDRFLSTVYIGLVPITGLVGTLILTITHYLYLWLILIAPIVFLLAAVPSRWAKRALPVAGVGFIVIALLTGGVSNLQTRQNFFGYRPAETVCLDEQLPAGMTTGYATFSDARRLSLTSKRQLRLIEIAANADPGYWLTNRADARNETGTFFYINEHGSEATIDEPALVKDFGQPDGTVTCDPGQYAIYYTDPAKIAKITAFYREHALK